MRKPTKTISGITPVAVMLPPRRCNHGMCTFCPSFNVPQSYTPKSPVVLRASELNYDAFKQVQARIKAFELMNHPTQKIELIIMGGTFLEYDKDFQYKFIKDCYDALNDKISKNLEESQKLNETSKHRCVALCVETRPDVCINFIDRMREFGVTRVELGVQAIDDKIYEITKRGHKVKEVIESTKALKNAGFKVGYHLMPGLPGSNLKKDLILFKKIFNDQRFRPDQLKIYPCEVLKNSQLEQDYLNGKYIPYNKEEIQNLLIRMLKIVPRYCRVMRIMREIPPEYIVAGTTKIDLRKDVENLLRKNKQKIKEIRFREIGFNQEEQNQSNLNESSLRLKITKYKASDGKEYFLEIVNKKDVLLGLLRLRIFIGDNKKQAYVRELHVYGKSLNLDEENLKFLKNSAQHQGLGKLLIKEAEKITIKNKINKLKIISGVGVRKYYEELGYHLEESYMVKNF
ncbi:tRNA uridine(34) 5-carboxymethylaminomethyl modification radical SAM/GNAT enzyme Elp3 [Candidatus Woesearchaeota archaeon]|nr:tRNA uridine(34) 5-carboxymethylaminomethyl modification radical SAM/GNAT enzyme Elp3 [Candidatus Woesearchaeota archaeon]